MSSLKKIEIPGHGKKTVLYQPLIKPVVEAVRIHPEWAGDEALVAEVNTKTLSLEQSEERLEKGQLVFEVYRKLDPKVDKRHVEDIGRAWFSVTEAGVPVFDQFLAYSEI